MVDQRRIELLRMCFAGTSRTFLAHPLCYYNTTLCGLGELCATSFSGTSCKWSTHSSTQVLSCTSHSDTQKKYLSCLLTTCSIITIPQVEYSYLCVYLLIEETALRDCNRMAGLSGTNPISPAIFWDPSLNRKLSESLMRPSSLPLPVE